MKCIISGYGAHLDTTLAMFVDHRGTPLWTEGIESPSFIAYGDGYLFAITENRFYAAIYAYRKEGLSYRMTDRRSLEGRELCHVVYSPKNRLLIGSCYGSGHVILAAFDPDTGLFGEVQSIEQKGEKESRQHCIVLNRAEDLAYTINLGLDQIIVYRIKGGRLEQKERISVKEGSGPRHARLSADERLLYVITEYSNEIMVYDTSDWSLRQTLSTLPQNYLGSCHCSTLCIAPDGRYLYAANRFADTIAVMEIDHDGLLSLKTTFDCGGCNPRHMELTPDGRDLVICCNHSDWVVFKRLNSETGLPSHTVRELPVQSPSCVVFVP
ncbi:MAG: beta-propeller fold lactonase family protein [Clostridia bacterium]|nr:beta-propeller fold lactonase family protein [Clostridia bacterium]